MILGREFDDIAAGSASYGMTVACAVAIEEAMKA